MAETRDIGELVDALVALQARIDELEKVTLVRVASRPTGDIEWTIRNTPKTGTLICNGQVVSRTEYPVLWQFAQDEGLVITGLFTVGDGSTTFGIPDFRDRVPCGASATNPLGTKFGSATFSITVSNLPQHSHSFSGSNTTSDHSGHTHGPSGNTGFGGAHTNHFPDYGYDIMTNGAAGGAISGRLARQPNDGGRDQFDAHIHGTGAVSSGGGHDHTVTVSGTTGNSGTASPTAINNSPPSVSGNYLIYV